MVLLAVLERKLIAGPARTVKLARKLRSEMTMPERLLWRVLRTRPSGLKFRRQHPAGAYVVDFYCAAARLAIEIDGMAHDGTDAMARDAARTAFLKSQHVAIMRVPAKVVFDNLESAVTRIVDVCRDRAERIAQRKDHSAVPLHHPADGLPPPAGEET